MSHFDLHVDNTGNATAYDISVSFNPPLQNGEAREGAPDIPLRNISVLKPGQGISSYLCEFDLLRGKCYTVTISWASKAHASAREENIYELNMSDRLGISRLGDDPDVEMAKHLKHLDEALSPLARGQKRLQVDHFSAADRLHTRRVQARQRRRWEQTEASRRAAVMQIESNDPNTQVQDDASRVS